METSVGACSACNGVLLTKFAESPPSTRRAAARSPTPGSSRANPASRRVEGVYRLGDDQAVALEVERGELREGERVRLAVDRKARHAIECNHTATHLLHAALRQRLGTHVRQAGSAVRPDKLRFDFTHGKPLTPEEVRAIEDRVNEWILESHPVRAIHTTRQRAEEMGAMALFGEKYGDEVRVIEVEDVSRELCGGTHVSKTSEIGVFKILHEGSSAANVRRIEAVRGPRACACCASTTRRWRDRRRLRTRPEDAQRAVESHLERQAALEEQLKSGGAGRCRSWPASWPARRRRSAGCGS